MTTVYIITTTPRQFRPQLSFGLCDTSCPFFLNVFKCICFQLQSVERRKDGCDSGAGALWEPPGEENKSRCL